MEQWDYESDMRRIHADLGRLLRSDRPTVRIIDIDPYIPSFDESLEKLIQPYFANR